MFLRIAVASFSIAASSSLTAAREAAQGESSRSELPSSLASAVARLPLELERLSASCGEVVTGGVDGAAEDLQQSSANARIAALSRLKRSAASRNIISFSSARWRPRMKERGLQLGDVFKRRDARLADELQQMLGVGKQKQVGRRRMVHQKQLDVGELHRLLRLQLTEERLDVLCGRIGETLARRLLAAVSAARAVCMRCTVEHRRRRRTITVAATWASAAVTVTLAITPGVAHAATLAVAVAVIVVNALRGGCWRGARR